ncbi:MAG: hypothetical protein ABIP94_19210 [Planctomycetota bacterium]
MQLRVAFAAVGAALWLSLGCTGHPQPPAVEGLPSSQSDAAFWQLVSDFSEPDGAFEAENLLSNERAFQGVMQELATLPAGGVYIGVGPEQNFTYLAALRPKLAFVVDIRRQNLVLHLFYKALFEIARNRADFLAQLFGRRPVAALPLHTPVDELLMACRAASPSSDLHERTLQAVKERLIVHHGFLLSDDDVLSLERLAFAFYRAGPDLQYDGSGDDSPPSYADLMTETDGHGVQCSYLATEQSFRVVQDLHNHNAIIPLVGDFAGSKALRLLGRYVADRGATITAFYVSNVEFYLFGSDAWRRFYANLAELPIDEHSRLLRSCSDRGLATRTAADASHTRLRSIAELVRAFAAGTVEGYYDVLAMPR